MICIITVRIVWMYNSSLLAMSLLLLNPASVEQPMPYMMFCRLSKCPTYCLHYVRWIHGSRVILFSCLCLRGFYIEKESLPKRKKWNKTRGPWATSLTWENTREDDLNIVNVFSLFRNYFTLENGGIPITKVCFVPSLIEMGPLVLEKQILKFRQCIFAIS